jgi:hypothetical protein
MVFMLMLIGQAVKGRRKKMASRKGKRVVKKTFHDVDA